MEGNRKRKKSIQQETKMGNASGKRKCKEGLARTPTEALAEAQWSEDERDVFEQLMEHWRVEEGELEEVIDLPTLHTKFKDQVTVVRWRGDLLVLKRLRPPSALYQELGVWYRLRPHRCPPGYVLRSLGLTSWN
jgi:hypothetical protein